MAPGSNGAGRGKGAGVTCTSKVGDRAALAVHRKVAAAGGLLAGLAMAQPAGAQLALPPVVPAPQPPGAPPPAPVTEADPLRVLGDDAPFGGQVMDLLGGFGLGLRARVATEYTDNVTRRPSGAPLRRGFTSRDDVIIRPSAGIDVSRPFGRQILFATADVGRDFHVNNTILDRNRFRIDGGVQWALGVRCSGRVQGGFATRSTQFDLFEDVVPSTQETTRFLANATCRTAAGLQPSIGYDRFSTRNKPFALDDGFVFDRSFSNVDSQGVNGSLGYPLAAGRGQIGIQGSWREFEFPNQPLLTGEVNGNEILSGGLFATYRLGAFLTLSATAGVTDVRPRSELVPGFSGGTGSLGLAYAGPRLGASINVGRNVSGSRGGFGNFSIADSANVALNYRLNRRVSANAGYVHVFQRNRGIVEEPETRIIRSSRANRYLVGADYRINRIFSTSLDLNHQQRSSDPSIFNYNATSVIFTVRGRL